MSKTQNTEHSTIPESIRALLPQGRYDIIARREDDMLYVLVRDFSSLRSDNLFRYQTITYDDVQKKIIGNDFFKERRGLISIISDVLICFELPRCREIKDLFVHYWGKEFKIHQKKTKEFEKRWWEFQDKNRQDEDTKRHEEENKRRNDENKKRQEREKLAEFIRLYQGSIDEVERDLNMRLKRIDTQTPETFLRERSHLWLRVKAAEFGANAVVHYRTQRDSTTHGDYLTFHVGTPVKFAGHLYRTPFDIIVEPRGEE